MAVNDSSWGQKDPPSLKLRRDKQLGKEVSSLDLTAKEFLKSI